MKLISFKVKLPQKWQIRSQPWHYINKFLALFKNVSPHLNFYGSNMSQPYQLLNKDFKEFVQFLNANAVEYLVVGGYALMAHGHPRYTGDIDFWVDPTKANITKLLTALHQFGFSSLDLKEEDFFAEQAVIQLGFPPARIDLMVAVSGVEFASAYQSRLEVDLDGEIGRAHV